MASKQLIACMDKAKGDAKKIAACKSSFAKKSSSSRLKQRAKKALEDCFGPNCPTDYYDIPKKWRSKGKSKKITKKFTRVG